MRKTVLIVNSDLEYGGAQRQIVELANFMDPSQFYVNVCSLSDYIPLADKLKNSDERLKVVQRKSRFDFTVVFRLRTLMKNLQVDIVHSYLFDATIASRLAGCLVPRPVIIGSERNSDYKLKSSDWLWLKMTSRLCDLTIANSHAGASFNSRLFGQRPDHYRVVHNGVDTHRFQPKSGNRIRAKLGLKDNHYVVGMFASFKEQKNHHLLLHAARHVIKKIPETRFLFVGDELHGGGSNSSEFKKRIIQLVNDLELSGHCIFLGNKNDVENYYAACDLTVLPSLYEGTPNVALESMASGVPVIATDVSDNALVIPDGQAGFIVPLNDEKFLSNRICQLLINHDLKQRFSVEARNWVVREYSGKRLAEKTAAVYLEAIQLKRGKKHSCS
jgi:glycosyltransferase involved in cell wall biosynthesis